MGHFSETTSPFPKVLPRSCFNKIDHESSNDIKIARVIILSSDHSTQDRNFLAFYLSTHHDGFI